MFMLPGHMDGAFWHLGTEGFRRYPLVTGETKNRERRDDRILQGHFLRTRRIERDQRIMLGGEEVFASQPGIHIGRLNFDVQDARRDIWRCKR
jgi:hypothetical protein